MPCAGPRLRQIRRAQVIERRIRRSGPRRRAGAHRRACSEAACARPADRDIFVQRRTDSDEFVARVGGRQPPPRGSAARPGWSSTCSPPLQGLQPDKELYMTQKRASLATMLIAVLAILPARAEETIKVGILHSLSGTMA